MGLADSFYLLCFDDRHRDVTICVMKFHLHNGADYQTFLQAGSGNIFIYLCIYFSANGPVGQFIIEGVGEEDFKCIKQSKEVNLTFAFAP